MKTKDNVRVIDLEDEDLGCGIEIGTTGVIIRDGLYNDIYSIIIDQEDIYDVKLNCSIIGCPENLNNDGTYQLYRRQLEIIPN